jgi:hypothetical protein
LSRISNIDQFYPSFVQARLSGQLVNLMTNNIVGRDTDGFVRKLGAPGRPELLPEVDEIVARMTPERIYGVGEWFEDFSQTSGFRPGL